MSFDSLTIFPILTAQDIRVAKGSARKMQPESQNHESPNRSKTGPRNFLFGFVAKHRFHFIVGRPRTHVISRLDFGSRVYLRPQWELARSLAERRLLAERECLGRCARVGGHLHLHGVALQPRAPRYSAL